MKHITAEVEALRNNMVCGHCKCVFVGTESQAYKAKYEKTTSYCSPTCRKANMKKKLGKPVPERGPCKNCGKKFYSRRAKKYCSMDCYISSDQFKERTKKPPVLSEETRKIIAQKLRTGKMGNCLECGAEIYQKKSKPRKYCSQICYRKYMAKRFDRWVANPQELALPQCYDEFMTQQELPCLVDGCNWRGKHLSVHANQAHGITADELKRAAGFNMGTGLVNPDLHQSMSARRQNEVVPTGGGFPKRVSRYRSLESIEHQKKAMALAGNGPQRHCDGCGSVFTQSTPFGRAKYCTVECRENHYAEMRRVKRPMKRTQDEQGKFVWVKP